MAADVWWIKAFWGLGNGSSSRMNWKESLWATGWWTSRRTQSRTHTTVAFAYVRRRLNTQRVWSCASQSDSWAVWKAQCWHTLLSLMLQQLSWCDVNKNQDSRTLAPRVDEASAEKTVLSTTLVCVQWTKKQLQITSWRSTVEGGVMSKCSSVGVLCHLPFFS